MISHPIQRVAFVALISLPLTLVACIGRGEPSSFDSADPRARIQAIQSAAVTNDTSAIPGLIRQLASDDPAVRYFAIHTLEELTGTTNGYDYIHPPWLRAQAINRWLQWHAQQDSASTSTHSQHP